MDENGDVSQPVVDDETGTCPLCSCLLTIEFFEANESYLISISQYSHPHLYLKAQHFCFHEQCPSCDDIPNDLLCWFCKHLRLRHLSHYMTIRKQTLVLDFGTVQDIRQRSGNCVFCSIVIQEGYLKGCNANSDWFMRISSAPKYKDIHLEFGFYEKGLYHTGS